MNRIILLLALSLGLSASAQSLYQGVYSPLPDDPLGPDAEYQLISRHYTATDSDAYLNVRKELVILRNRALTAYADKGESFVVWNPATQELRINECYTIQRDGKRVEMNPAGYVEQLPSACANCAPYNGLRELAIVHCGMEYGCTIVLDYTIHSLAHNVVEDHLVLNQDCPVRQYEIIVDLPEGQSCLFFAQNNTALFGGEMKQVNDGHALHYRASNLSQTFADPYLPDAESLYSTLTFTNVAVAEAAIDQFDPLPDAQLLLDSYADDNRLKYATSLRDYVVDYVGYKPLHPSMMNFRYLLPADTWQANCGTALDKAVLLAALLQQAGFCPTVIPGERKYGTVDLYDPASTYVRLTIDSVDYAFSPISKGAVKPYGAAVDKVDSILVRQSIEEPKLEPLAGRYSRLTLPAEGQGLGIQSSLLAPSRKAPLAVRPILEDYTYTVALPEGIRMVGKPVAIKKKLKGVGQMEISIRQEGNVLHVHRMLSIPESETIAIGKQYNTFREWMILWNQHRTITLQ